MMDALVGDKQHFVFNALVDWQPVVGKACMMRNSSLLS